MSRKLMLRLAAFFTLFTCVGHTIGTIQGFPKDDITVSSVFELMRQTHVTMPFGNPQTFATLLLGANLCVSVFLLVSGLIFVVFSTADGALTNRDKRILLLNSLGMLWTGIICVLCFFPLPAVCTGLAAVFGILASRKT